MALVIIIPAFVVGLFGLELAAKATAGLAAGRLDAGHGLILHGKTLLVLGLACIVIGLAVMSGCSWLIWWSFAVG